MQLSQAARAIGESATLKLNAIAQSLRDAGEPVIHLGGGEPVSRAPAAALKAAATLLATGAVRYTAPDGIPALKRAIARYTEDFCGRPTAPNQVIASAGAKQAIQICLQSIVDPGDEVLFPSPYWVSYPEMIRLAGGIAVPVTPQDEGLIPAASDIVDRIGPRTRAVILNSPNNPTGLCIPDSVVGAVVEACEGRGIWLLADDIYHRLTFDGRRAGGCAQFAKRQGDDSKIVLINGVSKQYAMTGFRIGWAVAPVPLIEAMTNLQSHETSGPSTLGQAAAVGALSGPQDDVESLRRSLEDRRDALLEALSLIPRVRVEAPQGTFYSFPDFSAYDSNSLRLAAFLLDKARVITVPGIEFGRDGHLRLSYCGSMADIVEGAKRIRWALDQDSPKEISLGDRTAVRSW